MINGHVLEAPEPDEEPLAVVIRSVKLDDLPYVRNSFAEGHKGAPGVASMTWRYYKRYVVPELHATLVGAELLGAYRADGLILGWLAFTRGRRVDAVHWVHTRYREGLDGDTYRRRGIMTALFDGAALRDRLVYTWRGAYPKHRGDGVTMDERLLPWLRTRGVVGVAYEPWEEWKS